MTTAEAALDRTRLIESLGLPADAPAPGRYIEAGGEITGPALASLVDADVSERLWLRWQPTQAARLQNPEFSNAFQEMLSAGVAMGYSLHRFESVSRALHGSVVEADRWVEAFERAVAARNAVALSLHVNPEVRYAFSSINATKLKDADTWNTMVSMMGDGLFYELGIIVPSLELVDDNELSTNEAYIVVNDARLPRQRLLDADQALVNDTVDRLTLLNVKGEETVNPANGSECAIIRTADVEACKQARLMTWDRSGHAVLMIASAARVMGGAFVNRWLTECFCTRLAQAFPTLVTEVKRRMSIDMITQILRTLIDEEISIRNLLRVFEVLALPEVTVRADFAKHIVFAPRATVRAQSYRHSDSTVSSRDRHVARVRSTMARYISHKYTRGGNSLVAYLLAPELENWFAASAPLDPLRKKELLTAIRAEVGSLPRTAQNPVLLTTAAVRMRLRREIAPTFPHLAVISYNELNPDMNIQPIARIEV